MVALSVVGSEGHVQLGDLVRSARASTPERLTTRLGEAVVAGELPRDIDIHALSRPVQTVQNRMSILARDGVSRSELEAVATLAKRGWDAEIEGANSA